MVCGPSAPGFGFRFPVSVFRFGFRISAPDFGPGFHPGAMHVMPLRGRWSKFPAYTELFTTGHGFRFNPVSVFADQVDQFIHGILGRN